MPPRFSVFLVLDEKKHILLIVYEISINYCVMTFKMWFEYSLKLKILFHLLKYNIFRFPKSHRGMVNRSTKTFSLHKIENKKNTVDEFSFHAFTNLFTNSSSWTVSIHYHKTRNDERLQWWNTESPERSVDGDIIVLESTRKAVQSSHFR